MRDHRHAASGRTGSIGPTGPRRHRRGSRFLRDASCAGIVAAFMLVGMPGWPLWRLPRALAPGSPPPAPPVYYGVHVPGWLSDLSAVTRFEAAAQKPVAVVMWYQGWGLTDGTESFQPAWMDTVRAHGSIPLVTWEPWLYTAGAAQPACALRSIIGGAFDGYIAGWAAASRAWGHPYFLRFAPEMNGNWFPWCEQVNGNQPGEYVAAWRHVHDLFVREGATNVTWVWSPNVEYGGSAPLGDLYPGDAYADWLGIDGYNWGTSASGKSWQSFVEVFGATYDALTRLSAKPIMIAEMASAEQGGSKADWIADALNVQLPSRFRQVRGIVWFDEDKETDWRIESSPAAQAAFAIAIAAPRYVANAYGALAVSPIPPPDVS